MYINIGVWGNIKNKLPSHKLLKVQLLLIYDQTKRTTVTIPERSSVHVLTCHQFSDFIVFM